MLAYLIIFIPLLLSSFTISKQREFSQWHYHVEDLIKQDFDKEDVYISMSTFYKPMRRIETIKELTNNFIDLDTYKTGFTKTQILMNLEENYFNRSIPRPNLIVEKNKAIVMDNATFHCKSRLYELCKNANKNLKLIFLPPYSPNLNPIEKYWATLKKNLKKITKNNKSLEESIYELF